MTEIATKTTRSKRRMKEVVLTEDLDDVNLQQPDEDYEEIRIKNIERNQQLLRELGLDGLQQPSLFPSIPSTSMTPMCSPYDFRCCVVGSFLLSLCVSSFFFFFSFIYLFIFLFFSSFLFSLAFVLSFCSILWFYIYLYVISISISTLI